MTIIKSLVSITMKAATFSILTICSNGFAQPPAQSNQNQQILQNQKQVLQNLQGITNNLNNMYQQEWNKGHPGTPAPAIAPMITNPVQQLLLPNASPAITKLLPSAQPPQGNMSTGQSNPAVNQPQPPSAPVPMNKQ